MKFTAYMTLPAVALLAACGGSSVDNLPTGFDDMADQVIADVKLLDSIPVTPKSTVLANGNASYSGIAGYELDIGGDTSGLTSHMNVNVNLTSSSISGNMSNFVTEDDEAVRGTLALRGGSIDSSGSGVAVAADLRGNLTGPDGERVTVDGDLDGVVGGNNGEYLGVVIEGTVNIDGTAGTIDGVGLLRD